MLTDSSRRTLLSLSMLCALLSSPLSHASELPAGFLDTDLSSWKERSFVGATQYAIQTEGGKPVLQATTDKTASLLYKEQTVEIADTPILDWEWKIESVYDIENEKLKSGDDYPARLYVAAKTGPLPWQTIAINYVWSSNEPVGSSWPNPYTKNAIMVVVQSGSALSGQWVSNRRNVVDDFKSFFGKDVKQIPGFAIMVDGDNTAQSGTAYFGRIAFSPKNQTDG